NRSHPPRGCPDFGFRELRVGSCSPQGLAAGTRMKSADSLGVAASCDLVRTQPRRPKGKSCDSASRLRLHTQKITKNDRAGFVRLSKIAHMEKNQDLEGRA